MKIILCSMSVLGVFFSIPSFAMISQNLTHQDKIMNQVAKSIQFNDVVRSIQPIANKETYKLTFEKHAAVYEIDSKQAQKFLKLLQQSKRSKLKLNISVVPDTKNILQVKEL